jgi:hypothetical protein
VTAEYAFFPWLRTGLSNQIQETDTPDAAPDPNHVRSSVSVRVRVQSGTTTPSFDTLPPKDIHLVGPGDVLGLHDEAIARIEPSPSARAVEPNYLPFVELSDADFPWRYTPARPSDEKLRPWLMLLAFQEGEFVDQSSAHLPSIRITTALQLDPAQLGAWAHVHLDGGLAGLTAAAAVTDALQHHPERLRSRILCPRRLVANQRYHLFLVPVFEAGRKVGLGEDPSTTPALEPAWILGQSDVVLPIYRRWAFETGEAADFETQARRLRAAPIAPEPWPAISLENLRGQLGLAPGTITAELQSALQPPGSSPAVPVDTSVRGALATEINEACIPGLPAPGADPYALVPPVYGRWHAAASGVNVTAGPWLNEVNLDPGLRAVAGLGADLVGEHQEKLVAEAWAQLDEVERLNDYLRRSALAAEVGERVSKKRFENRADASRLAVATRVLGQVPATAGGTASVAAAVEAGRLPTAALDPAMAKLCRAGTRHRRGLQRQAPFGSHKEIVTLLATTTTAAPHVNPGDVATLAPAPAAATIALPIGERDQIGRLVVATHDQDARRGVLEAIGPFETGILAAGAQIKNTMRPLSVVGARVTAQVPPTLLARASAPVNAQGHINTVMAAPTIDVPVVRLLLQRDLRRVAPYLDRIPDDGVALLAVNPVFIEALLVGMNHAMGAELLWRGFPTDQRGSYFKKFWDYDDHAIQDITPLATWSSGSPLGSHGPGGPTELMVLVIKSELLRRFGDVEIFAQRAVFQPTSALQPPARRLSDATVAGNVLSPLFRAAIGGVVVLGFAVSVAHARGGTNDAGWFLMFRERIGRARFGLDTTAAPGPLGDDVNDFAWQHLDAISASDSAQFIHLPPTAKVFHQPFDLPWGASSSSADIASILCQMPMTIGIHASDLVA